MPGKYTYVVKPVAVIEYGSDPPDDLQCEVEPTRLDTTTGVVLKPHSEMSMSW